MAPHFSLRGLLNYATSLVLQVPATHTDGITPYSGAPSCPIDGPVSCRNDTPVAGDACCFVYPSGRLLLAQFWDQEVHQGGSEKDWTLHGLWPDLCDGSYDAYCGMTPRFDNITEVLSHHGQDELLVQMNRYWIAAYGSNAHLWAHEYNKHASCINTLATHCYSDAYQSGMEVVDYFSRAVELFGKLDTYSALAQAGIVPTRTNTYPLEIIQSAVEQFSGGKVVLKCNGHGRSVLHEAWYAFFVQGSLQTGRFVPAKGYGEHGDVGNCADEVWYMPKKCRLPGGCDGNEDL